MKKHEFMTRLANALHSPSSVCSASLRSQLPRRGSRWVLPRQCTAEQAKRPGFPFGKPGRSHFYPVTISPTPFRM